MEDNTPKQDKYQATLARYNTRLHDEEVKTATATLLEKHLAENRTDEVRKFLLGCLDLTSLNCNDTDEKIMQLASHVNQFDNEYPDLKNVAAICVYPSFAEVVKDTLEVEAVKIACVAGGFPAGHTFTEVKIAETAMAVLEGADEIDTVMPVGRFLSGDYESLCDEIAEIKESCRQKTLKVILETGQLGSASNIKKAAVLAMYAGADFIKTSTGKEGTGATPEAAYVMCEAIREYYKQTGIRIGFKAAGGIRTTEEALMYYTLVKEILGQEWLTSDLFRIGTSRLANQLLSEIQGSEITFF